MTIEEFKIASKRTSPSLGSLQLDLAHMVLGMNTEVVELEEAIKIKDYVNVGEEIADLMFYFVNYLTFREMYSSIPIISSDKVKADSRTLLLSLYSNISLLQDLIKKYVAYGREIDKEKEEKYLTTIYFIVSDFCSKYNIDLSKALKNNVDKLLIRFPLGFTAEKANNRDLVAERKELEK